MAAILPHAMLRAVSVPGSDARSLRPVLHPRRKKYCFQFLNAWYDLSDILKKH
jgi:hypothetical protein